ncbi:ACT domain-containing protein [Actinopolymorpha sp. B9G3]|uniref:ACT domain-containing protein n=1 Tax=Actinopolymorpha sp. B9G3 TaxID=3158970 RepID=UPI0032D905FC
MYLVRVVLPDEPGALGTVASALGKTGADIVAVDVMGREDDGTAVDDFVVELPLGGRADALVSACHSVPGVRVVWLSRYAAGGNLRHDLEAIEAMTEEPTDAERVLVHQAPTVFRADWAFLVHAGEGTEGTQIVHATRTAPRLPAGEAFWFPLPSARRLSIPAEWEGHGWRYVAAAAVPLGQPCRALVVGRYGGPDILDSELARLAYLAALSQSVMALASEE